MHESRGSWRNYATVQQKELTEHEKTKVQMELYQQKNRRLLREIVLFNATTLKTVYNHEKNTLPTQSEIDEERELYQLYADKDWAKIKQKTRALRLNETES